VPVIAPNRIDISAVRQPDGTWTLDHHEQFDPEHRYARDNTLAVFHQLPPEAHVTACAEGDDGIHITYAGASRDRCGNIICGEFLQWASMGQMKLCDLLLSAMTAFAQIPVPDAAPEE
jgi:hypothetical protein